MKNNWNNILSLIQTLINDDSAVIAGLRNSPDVSKIRKNFERNVKALQKAVDKFDVLVPDPEKEVIELPFESDVFAAAWEEYKTFLNEEHGILLVPTVEKKRLTMLFRFAGKTESKAIEILDHLISTRQKNIFKPNDFQLSGDQPAVETETSFTIERNTI